MIVLDIDHAHDWYTLRWDDNDETVIVQLCSRGTFTVTVALTAEDALAFAAALTAISPARERVS